MERGKGYGEVNRMRFFILERQESRPLQAQKGVGMMADSYADIKDRSLAQTSKKRKSKYLVLFQLGFTPKDFRL